MEEKMTRVEKKVAELARELGVEWEIREPMELYRGERIIKAFKEGINSGIALGLVNAEEWPEYKKKLLEAIRPYRGQFNKIIYRTAVRGGRSRLYLVYDYHSDYEKARKFVARRLKWDLEEMIDDDAIYESDDYLRKALSEADYYYERGDIKRALKALIRNYRRAMGVRGWFDELKYEIPAAYTHLHIVA